MDPHRPAIADGSLMGAGLALLWAATAWCVGLNAGAIGAGPGEVAAGATWLAAPALLSAAPAWFLVRALVRLGIAARGSRLVRWVVFAWRVNLVALVIELLVLGWHASAGAEAPVIDLPVHVLGLWALALVNYVPALIAWQASRREREEATAAASDDAERGAEGREEF